jgi:hypothetical protein
MRAACSVSEGSDVLLLDVGGQERRRQLAERALAEVDLGELGHAGTDAGHAGTDDAQVAAHAALKEAVREVDERAAKHAGV